MCVLSKTFRVNLTLKSEISLLKIENWAPLFQAQFSLFRVRFYSKEFREYESANWVIREVVMHWILYINNWFETEETKYLTYIYFTIYFEYLVEGQADWNLPWFLLWFKIEILK